MSKKYEAKRAKQLGMTFQTASSRLKKSILFNYVAKNGDDICHVCGGRIDDVDNLSIEHKIPWMDSETPKELFFDLNNISFSHIICNTTKGRFFQIREKEVGMEWCCKCHQKLPLNMFYKSYSNGNRKVASYCKKCINIYNKEKRRKTKLLRVTVGGRKNYP